MTGIGSYMNPNLNHFRFIRFERATSYLYLLLFPWYTESQFVQPIVDIEQRDQ